MRKPFFGSLIILALAALAYSSTVRTPENYYVESKDGAYSVAMVFDSTSNEIRFRSASKGTGAAVERKFQRSGVYANDSNQTLLWPIDWLSNRVFISNNGECVVRIGIWPEYVDADSVITFYEKGQVIGNFGLKDISRKSSQATLSSDPLITFFDDSRVVGGVKLVVITSFLEFSYFDVRSGRLIAYSDASHRPGALLISLFGLILALIVFRLVRNKKSTDGR